LEYLLITEICRYNDFFIRSHPPIVFAMTS